MTAGRLRLAVSGRGERSSSIWGNSDLCLASEHQHGYGQADSACDCHTDQEAFC
jgi:hypothetical protein